MSVFTEDFNNTWLVEMPRSIRPLGSNFFASIAKERDDFVAAGLNPTNLGRGFFSLRGTQVVFYWHETNAMTDIIVQLLIKPQALVVTQIAKNPQAASNIHATNLYNIILKNNNKSLLLSDEYLTADGANIWKRLINLGHTVSVYNRASPESGLLPLKSETDLLKYLGTDPQHKNYQFVLSESVLKLVETRSFFNTKILRFLAGYPSN